MKLWKKLAFTGISALLLGTLAACGDSDSKDQAGASNSDTLQMYQAGDKPGDFDQLMEVTNRRIGKEIGARVNINYVGWGDYEKKMSVIISSEENYDIAFANNHVSDAQKGAFADLTESTPEYAEKICSDLDEAYIRGNLVSGKLYAFPVNGNVFAQQVLTFNKTLLDRYDLSIDGIQSYADAERVLKELHEKEPDMAAFAIGWSFKAQGNSDYPSGNTLSFAVDLDGDDSKIINQYDDETYIGLLRTMHNRYKRELISGDTATGNKDYPLEGNIRLIRGEIQGPHDYDDIILTDIAKQEPVPKAITVPLKSVVQAQVASSVIPDTSKDKEKSVEPLGLLNSDPELLNGLVWGIEGEAWEKVDGLDDKVKLLDSYQPNTHMSAWDTGNNKTLYAQESIADDMTARRDQSIADVETSPTLGLSFNTDNVKTELGNTPNVMDQYLDGLNTGTVDPDETLPKLKDALDKADYDKVLKEMQEQYGEFRQE